MKTPEPLQRKLHLDNGEWSYSMGGKGVRIRTPDCKTTKYASFATLLGVEGEDVSDYNLKVTPAVVKEYIENTLMAVALEPKKRA